MKSLELLLCLSIFVFCTLLFSNESEMQTLEFEILNDCEITIGGEFTKTNNFECKIKSIEKNEFVWTLSKSIDGQKFSQLSFEEKVMLKKGSYILTYPTGDVILFTKDEGDMIYKTQDYSEPLTATVYALDDFDNVIASASATSSSYENAVDIAKNSLKSSQTSATKYVTELPEKDVVGLDIDMIVNFGLHKGKIDNLLVNFSDIDFDGKEDLVIRKILDEIDYYQKATKTRKYSSVWNENKLTGIKINIEDVPMDKLDKLRKQVFEAISNFSRE